MIQGAWEPHLPFLPDRYLPSLSTFFFLSKSRTVSTTLPGRPSAVNSRFPVWMLYVFMVTAASGGGLYCAHIPPKF